MPFGIGVGQRSSGTSGDYLGSNVSKKGIFFKKIKSNILFNMLCSKLILTLHILKKFISFLKWKKVNISL